MSRSTITRQKSPEQKNFIFPSIGVHEFLAKRKLLPEGVIRKGFQNAVFDLWDINIPNFEILFNILLSPYRHDIVYAGGIHQEAVTDMLEKMGFKKIVDVGIRRPSYAHYSEKIEAFRLHHNALRFLSEQPGSQSFNRYLRNPLERIEDPGKLGYKLLKIFSLDQKNDTNSGAITEADFEELKRLISQAEKSYIDITNVTFNSVPMVELLANHGQFAMIDYLIQHGALFSTLLYPETKEEYEQWKKEKEEKNQSWYEYFMNKVKPIIDVIPGSG